MITQKFPYQKLVRVNINGVRHYQTPSGSKTISVTTILDKTKPEEERQALLNWKNRVGREKALEVLAESSGRGTRLHKYLEDYVLEGTLKDPGANPYSKQSHRMARKIIDSELVHIDEYYGSEVQLWYDGLFSGTTDLVARYKGELVILDYKTSNHMKDPSWITGYRLQLCAYILGHNFLFDTNIRHGIILMVTPDLQFQKFEVTTDDFDYWSNLWWDRVEQYYRV